ncbi:sensor domain-containing diguanylate cyclase [Methylocystis heyeri]|nr:diguanylate cyclase [Methylocystis heyeri]
MTEKRLMSCRGRDELRGFEERDHGVFAAKLMEHLAVAAFVIDRSSRVLIWNKALERLTGVPAGEMIGRTDYWRAFYAEQRPCLVDLLLAGDFSRAGDLYEAWSDPDVNPGGLCAENWCLMPRAGRKCYLAFDVGPIFDESGDVIAVVETLRDLTAHKRMEAELEDLAGRDALTSIANRRTFDNRLGEEWRRCRRMAQPLSLLAIDVDYFKQYNDAYGHLQGDECLKRVAGCLQGEALRGGDLAARLGGEEFSIILPQTPNSGALAVAERIRKSLRAARLMHGSSPISQYVTVSIGVVTTTDESAVMELNELVAMADAALYCAKRRGRDCVVSFSEDCCDADRLYLSR